MGKIARADVIGSLLRPSYLQEARKAAREGRLDPKQARAAEDRAIADAIALQENAGLDAVTDGEFRRMSFIATIGVRDAELGPLSGFETLVADAEWTGLWKNPERLFWRAYASGRSDQITAVDRGRQGWRQARRRG